MSEPVYEPSLHFLWLEVTDLQRSVDFYRETLGFPVQGDPGPFAIVHLGRAPLYLAPGAPRGLGLYIAIAVPDIEAMYRRLSERRYPTSPPVDEGWARYLNVTDPDGYRLILLQPTPAEAT